MDCRIALVLLSLCLVQAYYGQEGDCKPYNTSDISKFGCSELKVENAVVCYINFINDNSHSKAIITCNDGYKPFSDEKKDPKCKVRRDSQSKHGWPKSVYQYKCVPVQNKEHYHTPILIVLPLVGVILLFVIRELVNRRIIRCPIKTNLCLKANKESGQSQQDQCSEIVDVAAVREVAAVDRESGIYHCIDDAEVVVDVHVAPVIDEENSEYNTLNEHLNTRSYVTNGLPSNANVYAHIAYSPIDTNAATDTYSHINETKVSKKYSRSTYDKIAINGQFNKCDSGKNKEPVYNHTNTRRIAHAGGVSVFDTYSHVDNGQELTDDDINNE